MKFENFKLITYQNDGLQYMKWECIMFGDLHGKSIILPPDITPFETINKMGLLIDHFERYYKKYEDICRDN